MVTNTEYQIPEEITPDFIERVRIQEERFQESLKRMWGEEAYLEMSKIYLTPSPQKDEKARRLEGIRYQIRDALLEAAYR